MTAATRPDRCIHGHPLAGGNLLTRADGRRNCRDCGRAAQRRYRARKKAGAS